ncbi:beta-ketoacyl synthase N-terminal-like domain-containing protein [Flavobacterium sp. NRK1]|uniref:beta-ketoacyl synthase N-terminal-like domain-containing protein n=1 Tax=Flavobacterium sp. NRK1 TaxID=2954929 RepID=UPI002092A110|nr:beta-ketoacyl synthase N-terminal-like domain-containing protein [Flavobacterium sp. NRK1]MCO6147821.1 beta-ketoacyl synthase [Flavobacterium sp. NRK1]
MSTTVSIVSISSFSPLGSSTKEVWNNYSDTATLMHDYKLGEKIIPVAALTIKQREQADALKTFDTKYNSLDNSVLYSILASRMAVENAGWTENDVFGINIGSSRGATDLFEKHHSEFLETGKTGIQASPATTLGNISSWVAQDLKNSGPEISHSITCSTALHALLNGVAWLRAGMADKFLVGGSEAPLTPFTVAQMQAMKIYSSLKGEYPCRAFDFEKKANTMVLGEGAASACLEPGKKSNALAYIDGIGYATETLKHSVSISNDAECMQKSMLMALKDTPLEEVDAIVMHAPGTVKGDLSEYTAVQKIFGENMPLLTTNKWKVGHTFGASGLLSLEFAVLMLQNNHFIGVPYINRFPTQDKPLRKILVNAVGFGGNAVSVLISR